MYLSHKLGISAGVPFDRLDDMLGQLTEFGGIEKIFDHITIEEFPNYIEFNIETPSDVIRIGFAARKEELTYWAQSGILPWS